jgi:hypothetical protein
MATGGSSIYGAPLNAGVINAGLMNTGIVPPAGVQPAIDFNALATRYLQAREALTVVSLELNDRLSGQNNNSLLDSVPNENLVNFLGYYKREFLEKDTNQWAQVVQQRMGDVATNQNILNNLYAEYQTIQDMSSYLNPTVFKANATNPYQNTQYTPYSNPSGYSSLQGTATPPPADTKKKNKSKSKNDDGANNQNANAASYRSNNSGNGNNHAQKQFQLPENLGAKFSSSMGIGKMFD